MLGHSFLLFDVRAGLGTSELQLALSLGSSVVPQRFLHYLISLDDVPMKLDDSKKEKREVFLESH